MNNHYWGEFRISEIFDIKPGKRLTKSAMIDGDRPFVGATDSNNGITAWVGNKNESLDCNCLGVNYNGSVGETFYHPYECIFSDDVKRLHLKDEKKESRYVMLFLKTAILQQKVKYAYGYKFNESRMLKQTILLPTTLNGSPNYAFMEEYMKGLEQKILKPTIDRLCKQLIYSQIGGVTSSATNGKSFRLQRFLQKSNVEKDSRKQTTKLAQSLMFRQQPKIMVLMRLSGTVAA